MSPLHELLLKGLDRIEELGKRGSAITGVAHGLSRNWTKFSWACSPRP